MTDVFTSTLLLFSLYYAALMGFFAVGFRRVQTRRSTSFTGASTANQAVFSLADRPFVSVIVPARNEAACIERCVTGILANRYPSERFELIVVDDASTDATPDLLRQMQAQAGVVDVTDGEQAQAESCGYEGDVLTAAPAKAAFRAIRMPASGTTAGSRKRRALETGIEAAQGEIIVTTDADCRVPPDWIHTMAAAFDSGAGFVAGPVLFPKGGRKSAQAQGLEFLGLVAVGAGAIGMNRPILCNGANAGYRKAVYEDVGGFAGAAEGAAGDDELLMWKVAASEAWGVRFCADPQAAVTTGPAPDLRSFLRQRLRWGSLASQYPSLPVVAALAGVFCFYVLLLIGTLGVLVEPALGGAVLAAFIVKAAAEALVLVPACRHFDRSRWLVWLLPAQVFQAAYIVLCSALGTTRRYTWAEPAVAA